jgi:hypothetical protein
MAQGRDRVDEASSKTGDRMADDHSQRPYRSNDTIARGQPDKVPGSAPSSGSSSDPLAELARLIGQSDPFAEFGRDGGRRPAAPVSSEPARDWQAPPPAGGFAPQNDEPDQRAAAALPPIPEAQAYATPSFGRQPFGGAPLAADTELYQVEGEAPGYAAAPAGGYDEAAYHPSNTHLGPEQEDFYDDVPGSRQRMGVLVIAGVFALAVLGTAGAFGYRALFGSSGSSLPPPVIKADSTPSKIVPATASKDAQSNKLINDRVNDRGQGEKLVSREEQPVDIKDKPAGVGSPPGQDAAPSSSPAPLGSGVVGSEPKKVRTIAIHPDQASSADAMPTSAAPAATPPAPPRVTTIAPVKQAAPAQPPRVVNNPPPAADPEPAAPAPRLPVARTAPPAQQAAAPAPSNAPLSLSPDAPARAAPARAAAPAKRSAAVASTQTAPAATGGAGGYAVQVSSQRSEAEAQAAFRSLQGKYPGQLGGKQALVHKVDLGAKGTYYRAMVGPFGNANEASELCSSLKAAGAQCIVQKN